MDIRIGFGYDVHQLKEGETLILGGVAIPHSKGTVAHSDGDVLIHAICDALLGALSLGDIGNHFPDTKTEFKNISSTILLKRTMELVKEREFVVSNLDCTLILEKPKIAPHADSMKKVLAEILTIAPDRVSIKATTNEKMGYVGREEGVVAYATVLLIK
ncbi:MAG TPA: 2-C-methyl-D-erythritol 2,4-cyclodiphosphate synthase [Salinivirgaceae bacterium]|nr:2-C-methyl-D-erythritol 2,4-cyclodiphosphate synthase [Salinivirgaceae bacterium]